MQNYKQLQCFVAIVEEGGFTPAAQKLYMTQPAISWQIKILEGELGLKLIERSERRLTLTEAGQLFYDGATTILNQYAKIASDMEQYKNLETGSLRIGASTIPGEYMLSGYLAAFHREYPKADLQMKIADSRSIVKMLLQEQIRLGVVGLKPTEDQIESIPFQTDEIVCIAPKNHPLTKRDSVLLQDVLKEDILMREFGSGTRKRWQEEMKTQKSAGCEVSMELGSTRAIISAVSAGLGLSWVSAMATENENVSILALEDFKVFRSMYMIMLKNRTLTPLGEAFVKLLKGSKR